MTLSRKKKNHKPLKVIFLAWLIFTTAYFIKTQYDHWTENVWDTAFKRGGIVGAEEGYNVGYDTALTQIVQQSQECVPIPISTEQQSVQLINVACLTNASESPTELSVEETIQ